MHFPRPTSPALSRALTWLETSLPMALVLAVAGCVPTGGQAVCHEAASHIENCTGTRPTLDGCSVELAEQALSTTCAEMDPTNDEEKAGLTCHPGLTWAGFCAASQSQFDRSEHAEVIDSILVVEDALTGEKVPREGAEQWVALENELYASGYRSIAQAELDLDLRLGHWDDEQPFRLTVGYLEEGANPDRSECAFIEAAGGWTVGHRGDFPQHPRIDTVTTYAGTCTPFAEAHNITRASVRLPATTPTPIGRPVMSTEGLVLNDLIAVEQWEGGSQNRNNFTAQSDAAKVCARATLIRIESLWNHQELAVDGFTRYPAREIFDALVEATSWDGTVNVFIDDFSRGGTSRFGRAALSTAPRQGRMNWLVRAGPDGRCNLPTLETLTEFSDTCRDALADPTSTEGCYARTPAY